MKCVLNNKLVTELIEHDIDIKNNTCICGYEYTLKAKQNLDPVSNKIGISPFEELEIVLNGKYYVFLICPICKTLKQKIMNR